METQETGVLPDKKKRSPVIYAVIHTDDASGSLEITECPTRGDVKRFVNSLSSPDLVQKVYRISAVIEMKKKVVMSF